MVRAGSMGYMGGVAGGAMGHIAASRSARKSASHNRDEVVAGGAMG